MQALKNYFLCNHRMNRKPYLFISLSIIFAATVINLCLAGPTLLSNVRVRSDLMEQKKTGKITQVEYDQQEKELEKKTLAKPTQTAIFIISLIASLLVLPADIMRLKDMNYYPFLAFAMLLNDIHYRLIAINLLTLILTLILIFKRGTIGSNRYGADPLETQAVG